MEPKALQEARTAKLATRMLLADQFYDATSLDLTPDQQIPGESGEPP